MPPVIAVTGASGRVGGRVAARLSAAGVATRLVGRDPARLPDLPGAVAGPAASYGDGEAMRRALDGADTLAMTGRDGVLRGPAGQGRVAAVAHDDIADAAAAVLLDGPGPHDRAVYDLTGPTAFSLAEAAAELTRAAGRTVRYHPDSEDEAYASRAGFGAEEWEVTGWGTSYEAMGAGEMALVSDAVPRLTGHPAQSLREYLAEHPRSYAHLLP